MKRIIGTIIGFALIVTAAYFFVSLVGSVLPPNGASNTENKISELQAQLDEKTKQLEAKEAELQELDREYFELLIEMLTADADFSALQSKIESLETMLQERYPAPESAEAPWNRYMGFMTQMFAGNADGTWEYLSSQDKEKCSREVFRTFFSLYLFGPSEPGPPPNYVFLDQAVNSQGTMAIVWFLMEDGSLASATLFAEEDGWHLRPLGIVCS